MRFGLKKVFSLVALGIFFLGCQQKPTRALEESVNVFNRPVLLLDTRRSLDYVFYHVSGANNVWWQDFVSLDPKTQNRRKRRYIFDKDLTSVIERLAHRGVSPEKTIYLIGYKKDSTENKRWSWLLKLLEISDVKMISMDEARKKFAGRRADPEKENPWALKTSIEFQYEFIINKAQDCFLNFLDSKCN
jgi:3-mercaptopyruvate sulfurtransferase SseA